MLILQRDQAIFFRYILFILLGILMNKTFQLYLLLNVYFPNFLVFYFYYVVFLSLIDINVHVIVKQESLFCQRFLF